MTTAFFYIRQNTEDVYTGEETWVDEDTVECIKRITRGASQVRSGPYFGHTVSRHIYIYDITCHGS